MHTLNDMYSKMYIHMYMYIIIYIYIYISIDGKEKINAQSNGMRFEPYGGSDTTEGSRRLRADRATTLAHTPTSPTFLPPPLSQPTTALRLLLHMAD